MTKLGASFSLHRCSELMLPKQQTLKASLEELGLRRFRLMSYWNIHEPRPRDYNFTELDWQLDMIHSYGGQVSLCLGKRQPRWPECHMPDWALNLSKQQWYEALYEYVRIVVDRYKNHPSLVSWQLENEALLSSFGHCPDNDYNRKRLQRELEVIKTIDDKHPIIMSLSDSWGIPLRHPRPDIYATSLYRITINKNNKYVLSKRPPLFYRTRAELIKQLTRRPVFIHELQAEPWLNRAISEIPIEEQFRYMNPDLLKEHVDYAKQTSMDPIDLWGLEWWYWLKLKHNDSQMWLAAQELIS